MGELLWPGRARSADQPKAASPESIRGCPRSPYFSIGAWIFALALFATFPALAHDPYEITSTLFLHTNRTELQVEMEFRTGVLLAGYTGPVSPDQVSSLFNSMQGALSDTAAQFFKLTSRKKELYPEKTSIVLGVEDHIQFKLLFPRLLGQSVRCEARGLEALTNQGPYGASITLLDMVNKKVLGQSVMFKDSPPAEFTASVGRPTLAEAEPSPVVRLERSDLLAEAPRPPEATALTQSRLASAAAGVVFAIAGCIGFLLAIGFCVVLWRASRKERVL